MTQTATCTEREEYIYRVWCKVCGTLIEARRDWRFPLGHNWGEWVTVQEASELQEGIARRTCARCGAVDEHITAKLETHNTVKIEAVPPTCTEPGGIEHYKCSVCGALFSDVLGKTQLQAKDIIAPAKGHSAGEWVDEGTTKQPGCIEPGYKRLKLMCKDCGEEITTRDEELSALGHSWGEWVTVTPATEETEGSERRSCGRCGLIETRTIPKLIHAHNLESVPRMEPFCTSPGNIAYWTCRDCGRLFTDAEGQKECSSADTVIPAKGHSAEDEWRTTQTEATCTENGLIRYVLLCRDCDEILSTRAQIVPALGHDWSEWLVTTPATEEASGIESRTCTRCDKAETRVIPRLEHRHSMTKIDAKNPTCTEQGSITFYRCSGCGRTFADAAGKTELFGSDIILPAKGHSAESEWELEAVTKQPGCIDQGFKRMKLSCAECGEKLSTRGESIAALGHIWSEWKTTLEPTETQEGKQIRVCASDTTHVEERTLPALKHTHTMTAVAENPAQCTEAGNIAYYRCSGCGLLFLDAQGTRPVELEDTVIGALGHIAGDWTGGEIVKAPACMIPGTKRFDLNCSVCKELLSTRTQTIPAVGHDWQEPSYLWSDDYSIVIVEHICKNDAAHIEQEITAEIAIDTLIPVSCEEDGELLYRAVFENPAFEDQRTLTNPAAGHKWSEWEITRAATETEPGERKRICENDTEHVQTDVIPSLTHVHELTAIPEEKPTCTDEGSKAYWFCDSCGEIFTDGEGKNEVDIDDFDTLLIPPLGHSWKQRGEVVWTDDHYSALLTFVCERDASHTRQVLAEAEDEAVLTVPTKDADGKLVYTVLAEFDGKAYEDNWLEPIPRAAYTYIEKQESWWKGSGENAVFRVRRVNKNNDPENDLLTSRLFTDIEIDTKTVPTDQYSSEPGSVIIKLKPGYLESLTPGLHTLRTNFSDGQVFTQFQVMIREEQPTPPPTTPPTAPPTAPPTIPPTTPPTIPPTVPPTASPTMRPVSEPVFYPSYTQVSGTGGYSYVPTTAPRTGDESALGLWSVCVLLSGTILICCARVLMRKTKYPSRNVAEK